MTGVGRAVAGVRVLRCETGATVVTVVLWLPVVLLLGVFVIDVANWFEHRRHLQLQADAAALAAAAEFRFPCDDARIEDTARLYSGELSEGYNQQVGSTHPDDVHLLLNSSTYYNQSEPVDGTVSESPPCDAAMVDVKLTETDLPLAFRVAGLFASVPFVNAHARVKIFQKERLNPALPIALSDPNPRSAEVQFVDEATGEVLGSRELTRNGTANGLAIWDNSSTPLPVEVDRERIGMRVKLSGRSSAASSACGDRLVECYDAGSANGGLLYVRGYSMAGLGTQPAEPIARSVYLLPGSCADPYFVKTDSECTIGVHAEVDFGPCQDILDLGARLTVRAGGSAYSLRRTRCELGTTLSEWETIGTPIPVQPGAGPIEITLDWEQTQGTVNGHRCTPLPGNRCKGSFGVVQRTFSAAAARSGPIALAQLWEGGSAWANSLERCSELRDSCTYDLVAKIGLDLNLQENAQTGEEPPVALRVVQGDGVSPMGRSVDCDPDPRRNLREELYRGCAPQYERNPDSECPQTSNELWSSPEPWRCVALEPGVHMNQVFQGMNLRVHGQQSPSSCVGPNHWAEFPALDPGDPRLVPVLLTAFGAFSRSQGSAHTKPVPVHGFASFYVTGWAGQGEGNQSNAICPSDDAAEPGTVVGRFVKYVQSLNDGSAGDEACELSGFGSCVAVLTE